MVQTWIDKYKPDVIISSGRVYQILEELGYNMPGDLGFAALDIAEGPEHASGADHRHRQVGCETLKLVLSDIYLNNTGIPRSPKIVLVDSHYRSGATLRQIGEPVRLRIMSTIYHDSNNSKSLGE